MRTTNTASALILGFVLGCGPSVDDEPEPLGHLEYGSYVGGWYRLEQRIEYVPDPQYGSYQSPECAYLTEPAFAQIEATLAALDPTVDYDFHQEDCLWQDDLFTNIYVEGLEHSPFACGMFCCRDELSGISSIYFFAGNELSEHAIEIPSQPFPVIDLDRSCDD